MVIGQSIKKVIVEVQSCCNEEKIKGPTTIIINAANLTNYCWKSMTTESYYEDAVMEGVRRSLKKDLSFFIN